jgi:Lipopolysaccharide export system permease LptF/LptG
MTGYVLWLSAALQGSKGTQKTRMSLIERYMFRRIGLLALGALTVTTGIALTTQVLLRVDLLASTGQSLLTIGELALYLIPGMIAVALPFAVLISVLQTMRAMNQDSELVVLEASGSGILQRVRDRNSDLPCDYCLAGTGIFTKGARFTGAGFRRFTLCRDPIRDVQAG